MYYLILFLPLLSAFTAGIFGRYLGDKGAGLITSFLIILTSLLSWISFYEVGICGSPVFLDLWNWIETGWLKVSFGLMFDSLTVSMLILVTTVSGLVHVYSTEYMNGDPHLPRFMSYLSLFTFFMIVLVTADNLLQLFIGWEGVGLCSYLLINFWFTRIQANKSAMKAMIVNRVGDIGVILAMFFIFTLFQSLDFSIIFSLSHKFSALSTPFSASYAYIFQGYEIHTLTLIGICLLIGAIGKSAQLGLHTWLPDAMEGPTPVSALIHAATMVTAGIFLLIRFSPLLEFAPNALSIVVIIGASTAFFAASVGLVQNDIKKVIAYSTCSQLGYMAFACGLSNYSVSLFHLVNHGFFKALLFLSAGCVIHSLLDEQDMRKFGGLIKSLPFSYIMILIGSLSLMGFPFLTGFYSKDAILELAYGHYSFEGSFAYWLGTLSAFFTAFYSMRLIYLTFINYPNSSQFPLYSSKYLRTNSHKHSQNHETSSHFEPSQTFGIFESPLRMLIPLGLLALGSIFVGFLFREIFIGMGTPFYQGSLLFIWPSNGSVFINSEFIDPFIKLIPVVFSLIGATLSFILIGFTVNLHEKFLLRWYAKHLLAEQTQRYAASRSQFLSHNTNKVNWKKGTSQIVYHWYFTIYTFLNNKWHFDFLYNFYLVKPLISFGHHVSYKTLDRGYFELMGPKGLISLIKYFSKIVSDIQSGWVYNYAFSIFLFITLSLWFFPMA